MSKRRVKTPHVQQRMVDNLQSVDGGRAQRVADGLGLKLGTASRHVDAAAPIEVAPSLSMLHAPVETVQSRVITILAADGADNQEFELLVAALTRAGAVPMVVGTHGGAITSAKGISIPVDHALMTVSSPLFDAVAVPNGPESSLFVAESFRHLKAIYV